ncbi:hypothetical protein RHSIM_Rhsim03G0131500 [Rhododendron simsii]|uniref:Uncharacterized protein n=1 Tax=Rhododendron simsii TaxID=118357 RepID=A0A834LTZ2_RHOSS|nr:hypothetical protein RHSIM_Rhsim03G0131500 [Rhododendron simsii]
MSGSNLRSPLPVNAKKRTHEQGALGLLREDEMEPRGSGVIFAMAVECLERLILESILIIMQCNASVIVMFPWSMCDNFKGGTGQMTWTL